MRTLAPLILIAYLSSCITYTSHVSDPEPKNQALFLGVELGLGVATGIGSQRKRPERPAWQHFALGLVTVFALDAAIALLVWQADKKSE